MTGKDNRFSIGLGEQVRIHAPLASMVAIHAFVAFWLSHNLAAEVDENLLVIVLKRLALLVPQMIFIVLFWRLLYHTYLRTPHRVSALKHEIAQFLAERDRLVGGTVAVLVMSVSLVAFAKLKGLIPLLHPFSWDLTFVELDRTLHFGTLPHEFLHTIFGWHYSISFFTGIYNIWLFLMYFSLLIACFLRPESKVRMRFLIAFVLTWAIGGNLMATIFSSAGPVYLQSLGLGDAYASLMQRLRDHASSGALTVIDTQNLLWKWYAGEQALNAISAFPSMHVASTTLMALFAFRWHRWAGIAATAFTLAIMAGSVLLAWHYAVDGYVGALVALLCWKFAGWVVRSRPVIQPSPVPQA